MQDENEIDHGLLALDSRLCHLEELLKKMKKDFMAVLNADQIYIEEMLTHLRAHVKAKRYKQASYVERELFIDVLKRIRDGSIDPLDLAERVLESLELDFPRTT